MVLYIACIAHIVCVAGEYRLHVHSWHIDFILTDRKWDAHPSSLSLFFLENLRADLTQAEAKQVELLGKGQERIRCFF